MADWVWGAQHGRWRWLVASFADPKWQTGAQSLVRQSLMGLGADVRQPQEPITLLQSEYLEMMSNLTIDSEAPGTGIGARSPAPPNPP